MKKITYISFILIISFSILAGCGQKQPKIEKPVSCLDGAPDWVTDPYVDGKLAALGKAYYNVQLSPSDLFEAETLAKDDIARMITIKTKNMLNNFSQTTGIGDKETINKAAKKIANRVNSQILQKRVVKKSWLSPQCRKKYVLVVLEPGQIEEVVFGNTIVIFEKLHLWQQVHENNAFDQLTAEIKKEFGDY